MKVLSSKKYEAIQANVEALRTELKGYYAQSEEINEYFKIIAPQLKGLDLGKIGAFDRDSLKEAYETITPVMGIINKIAEAVGEVSKYIELRKIGGDYIEDHWLLDLLDKPNDRFSRRKFFTAWAINRLIFGDAFVYAPQAVGKNKGQVKEMYILPGQRIAVEKGGLASPMKGVRLTGSVDGEIDIEGKVFESFDYNLDDTSFLGTSKLASAAVYLTILERSMNRQATSLKNGGPANLITPTSGGAAPLPAQLDDMEQKLNGKSSINRNLMLKAAIDVHTLGDRPVDLSILESHKEAINVLCFVYKVPVDLYLGQAKYENAKEAKKTIYEEIAIPMVNEFIEDFFLYLKRGGKAADGLELCVNTDKIDVLKEKRSDALDCLAKMHASLNELREANGYEPIDEDYANEPIIPSGVTFGNEASLDF